MAKVAELSGVKTTTEEDRRRALELAIRKLNEVIRALNTLLP